jgi:hypothetical protein
VNFLPCGKRAAIAQPGYDGGQFGSHASRRRDGGDSGILSAPRRWANFLASFCCYDLDEVKDIRDKMIALEQYVRQARNIEAGRHAAEIRLRAG